MDEQTPQQAPSLWRRMASFLYEGVVLFGVTFISGYLFSALTQQRSALQGKGGLQAFEFVVLGIYFIWFWTHGGQTVAMKSWHLRVVDEAGAPISQWRALARYLLAWLWFLPALVSVELAGLHSGGAIFGALMAGVAAYVLLARLHPSRQFLHDVLCRTRLVTQLPASRKKP